jgi:endothelin-converting enzyme/putative endopeptidase
MVDPCADFYKYACGGWGAAHPIPAEKARVSRYDEMIDRNVAWTRELLERAADARANRSAVEQQVGDDYASCLNENAIDARGLGPLREELQVIDRALQATNWAEAFAYLQGEDVPAPFELYVAPDFHSPDQVLLQLDLGGLGLRDRDEYLRDDPHSRQLLAAYQAHLQRVFTLLGDSATEAGVNATRVLAIETELARATPTAVMRRDREHQYHPTPISELEKHKSPVRWREYFQRLGVNTNGLVINVAVPEFLDAVQTLIATKDRSAWNAYLTWHTVRRSTPVLPSTFVTASFEFYEKAARGVVQMMPRWKRCARLANEHLGESIGRMFVREHFSEDARARVLAIIQSVRSTLREDIENAPWMSPATRREALIKVDSVAVKVGHPDHWRDYSELAIDRADAYGNDRRARLFEIRRQLSKLGKPTDRSEWGSLPQTLDGFATRSLNQVAFTAGLLQRPFFDPSADAPMHFGALGGVAGHELIHHFDDQGRKFDARGGLRDWWTPVDARRYSELAQCFVDEYSRAVAVDDLHLNGQLTLGENLADNGGLRLAYRAAQLQPDAPKIDGFSAAQRFFLAWAQIRCENVTDAEMRHRTYSDPHSPGRFRVNVVVSNMEEFASAFGCAAKTPMAPAHRCILW